jgi:hypothetical protein
MTGRLLKKAHLPRWRAGYPSGGWVRRCDVRVNTPPTHLRRVLRAGYPSKGWVTPPCIWTFLSSLGVNEFFSILLVLRRNDFASTQIFHHQSRHRRDKDRKESQGPRIQPRTGDGNRPDCSGERILKPLESAGFSGSIRISQRNS